MVLGTIYRDIWVLGPSGKVNGFPIFKELLRKYHLRILTSDGLQRTADLEEAARISMVTDPEGPSTSTSRCVHMYVYTFIHIYIHTCTYKDVLGVVFGTYNTYRFGYLDPLN